MIDLRLGRWQDVLSDVTCDALIFDGPHSTTGKPHNTKRSDGYAATGLLPTYAPLSAADIREFCESWRERTRGWWVSVTDYDLSFVWRDEMRRIGRYALGKPVTCVIRAMSARLQNDGPSSWTLYAMVSRPHGEPFSSWGVLDGAYVGGRGVSYHTGGRRSNPDTTSSGRGKPRWLMNAIVRDYSKRGDVVCDPFAGYGSTLASCAELGRIGIGAEQDPAAHTEAVRRLARPLQLHLGGG